jgi:hypothetical protein
LEARWNAALERVAELHNRIEHLGAAAARPALCKACGAKGFFFPAQRTCDLRVANFNPGV